MRHRIPWIALELILPLFWKGITCKTYSIDVNRTVSVQEGLCVTIPCTFTADGRNTFSHSFGLWYQYETNNIVATNDKTRVMKETNFNLTGNPDTGDCTLTITDARTEDGGQYFFRFEESETSKVKYNYHVIITTITVTDFKEPVISDLGTVIAGVNKTLTCTPPVNCSSTSLVIQWKKSNVEGIWKNSSTVTFTPSANDHQKYITCEITNSNGTTTQKTILLYVYYPPRNMEITYSSSKGTKVSANQFIGQTETLTLICRVDGNPTVSVVWVKGDADNETSKMSNNASLAMINVTYSMADVYRCLAWNAHGLREQRIQVGIKQDNPEPTVTSRTGDNISYRDIAIAFICGISVTILILGLYKLITRKKITQKKSYVRAEEPSVSTEPPTDEIYMNVSKTEQKVEEAPDNNIQLDSSDVTLDQEDLHYSTLAFPAKPSKVPSSQPETEYAEVKVK